MNCQLRTPAEILARSLATSSNPSPPKLVIRPCRQAPKHPNPRYRAGYNPRYSAGYDWEGGSRCRGIDYDEAAFQKAASNPATRMLAAVVTEFVERDGWVSCPGMYMFAIEDVALSFGVKPQALFLPIRVALTGKLHGIDLAVLIEFLGRGRCVARLRRFIELVNPFLT